MVHFLIHPIYIAELLKEVNVLFTTVEGSRNAIIPSHARDFMTTMIVESVTFRAPEWMQKYSLDCNDISELHKTIGRALDSAYNILSQAEISEYEGNDYILLANVIECMHHNWCGIFPFCK